MGKASVLLLVKLSTDPDLGFAPEDNPWCNLCGRLPAEAPMVQGAAQTAPGSTVEEDPDMMDNFDFCLCCAKKSRRSVAADYATLCEECASYVIEETEAASR